MVGIRRRSNIDGAINLKKKLALKKQHDLSPIKGQSLERRQTPKFTERSDGKKS